MNNLKPVAIKSLCITGLAAAALAGWWYWTTTASPEARHRQVVMLHLNDPESAKFNRAYASTRDERVWCGQLNARNRMGGMVGFTRYVLQMPSKNLDSITQDNPERARLFSDITFADSDGFQGKWSAWCE